MWRYKFTFLVLSVTESTEKPLLELSTLSEVELGAWNSLMKHGHNGDEHLRAHFGVEAHEFFEVHWLIVLECAIKELLDILNVAFALREIHSSAFGLIVKTLFFVIWFNFELAAIYDWVVSRRNVVE